MLPDLGRPVRDRASRERLLTSRRIGRPLPLGLESRFFRGDSLRPDRPPPSLDHVGRERRLRYLKRLLGEAPGANSRGSQQPSPP
jgi:hypothetical protein